MLKNSALSPSEPPTKQPAHQSVYEQLRASVLFGDLAPGQAVTIQGLTEEMAAGITPVREAIRRLISDGALRMMGNRRVIVPNMTTGDLDQLEFMRKTLEPELAALAAQHVNDKLLSELKRIDTALNTAISKGDISAYLMQNYKFHATLNAAAQAPILTATVDRLWLRFGPSLRVVCGRSGTMNLPDKHLDLLRALEAGDPDRARFAIMEDVKQGIIQIREALSPTAPE